MTTILRLEGLDAKAGTEDIRGFFDAFYIPDGGVYIVGGSLGEAFIAFGTESEAQLALLHSGNFLKGTMVTLHLSSIREMEKRLENSLKKKKSLLTVRKPRAAKETSRLHAINRHLKPKSRPDGGNATKLRLTPSPRDGATVSSSAAFPLDPDTANLPASNALQCHLSPANKPASDRPLDNGTAFLLGICTVLQGLASTKTEGLTFEFPKADGGTTLSDGVRNPEHASDSRPGYVRLFGLPASTTKDDLCKFFKGLQVQEAIVNVELGISRGSLVKFASKQEASEALGFNQQLLGSTCVEVRGADEKMWEGALQECRNAIDDWSENRKRFPKERLHHEGSSVSSPTIKRKLDNPVQFKPSKKPKPDGPDASLSKPSKYRIMVKNLPRNITKTDIKQLFGCADMPHKDVLHLLDKTGNITDTAFVAFTRPEDFDYAINLSGCHVGSGTIEVTPITKQIMWEMMAKNNPRNQRSGPTDPRLHSRFRKPDPLKIKAPQGEGPDRAARQHIFIRNMPASVKRSQIRSLFSNFNLSLADIVLLQDGEGSGRGEAVVTFESEQQAALAQRMHGEEFLGTNLLLTRINLTQKENILNS